MNAQETSSVLALLNKHLAEDGLQLVAKHPQRWYLQHMAGMEGQHGFPLQTTPLSQALGQSIFPLLPKGNHHYWHRLSNELQMLLHRCEVKKANAVWLWGGGDAGACSLTGDPYNSPYTVVGGGACGQTAARAAMVTWHAADDFADLRWAADARYLVILERLRLPSLTDQLGVWQTALDALDSAWFLPARNGLNAGRFTVSLSACDGRTLHCQPAARWKFWQPQAARWDQLI